MKILRQKKIKFNTTCDAIYDKDTLAKAIIWYSDKPVCETKKVYMFGRYPAITIYDKKIHIHRLIVMYSLKQDLESFMYVHHKDGNRLNALLENLELIHASKHQSLHNKGKKLTKEHRAKISEANKKRKGIKFKKNENKDLIK